MWWGAIHSVHGLIFARQHPWPSEQIVSWIQTDQFIHNQINYIGAGGGMIAAPLTPRLEYLGRPIMLELAEMGKPSGDRSSWSFMTSWATASIYSARISLVPISGANLSWVIHVTKGYNYEKRRGENYVPCLILDTTHPFDFTAILGYDGSHSTQYTETEWVHFCDPEIQ